MKWERIGKSVKTGERIVIIYQLGNTDILALSVKKSIPHANGIGTWQHTTYFSASRENGVIQAIKEYYSLADAKKAAEELIKEN